MERNHYFINFPDGDEQEIFHPLRFGDIVDLNGNICSYKELDPKRITYKVNGINKKIYFKDISWYFKLELLTANEVNGEINYQEAVTKKKKAEKVLEKLYNRVEKRNKKRKI